MSKIITYNPNTKTVTCGESVIEGFYCGEEMDEIAITVVAVKFGIMTPKEAYDKLVGNIINWKFEKV